MNEQGYLGPVTYTAIESFPTQPTLYLPILFHRVKQVCTVHMYMQQTNTCM